MKYLIIIILNLFSFVSMAQNATKNMELSDLFRNDKKVFEFIEHDFKEAQGLNNVEKVFHPMGNYLFNMIPKSEDTNFSFFGKSIDLVYAFHDNKDFALYIMLYLKFEDLKMLTTAWGYPTNVTKEDFLIGDFTSLFWGKKEPEIVVARSFVYEYGKDHYIIHISNMKLSKLYRVDM